MFSFNFLHVPVHCNTDSTPFSLVSDTPIKIFIHQTVPGFRLLDKYAVYCGGGTNTEGLFDMILIKDTHIKAAAE